jgi:hypothetical protein
MCNSVGGWEKKNTRATSRLHGKNLASSATRVSYATFFHGQRLCVFTYHEQETVHVLWVITRSHQG